MKVLDQLMKIIGAKIATNGFKTGYSIDSAEHKFVNGKSKKYYYYIL